MSITCARQRLGMTDNCALCKALHPELYDPCRGEPDKVAPVKKPQFEVHKDISINMGDKDYLSLNSSVSNLSHNSKNKNEIITKKTKVLSYEEAREEIINYIKNKSGKFHISEISEDLRIDIGVVIKIVEGL